MSADPARAAVGLIALLCGTAVLAADDELPDAEFLEYLGSWDASDEEWLIFDDDDQVARREPGREVDEDEANGEDNES